MKKRTINTVLVVGLGSIGKRHIGIINTIFSKVNVIVLRHKECDKEESNSPGIYQGILFLSPIKLFLSIATTIDNLGLFIFIQKLLLLCDYVDYNSLKLNQHMYNHK